VQVTHCASMHVDVYVCEVATTSPCLTSAKTLLWLMFAFKPSSCYLTMCWSLKCTGEWPSMPYAGLYVLFRSNLNLPAKPKKLGPSQNTVGIEVRLLKLKYDVYALLY
jgi:hypothetical protein